MPHRRVHQYRGGHRERHGGRRLVIDSSYYSVGQGIWVPRERLRAHCGVRISFGRYAALRLGSRGPLVRAAQCVLRDGRHFRGRVTGFYGRRTTAAVRHFQAVHPHLRATGVLDRRTWTALLSRGDRPALKYGSQGIAVRRVQRAVNAVHLSQVPVDGVFGLDDSRAVQRYQRRHHLPVTGVVSVRTWRLLQRGVL
jgi:peptidoglycan hydrolase-like protein with peptidoglycan-binding domain